MNYPNTPLLLSEAHREQGSGTPTAADVTPISGSGGLLARVRRAQPTIDRRPLWIQRMDRNAKVFSVCPDGRFDPGHGKSA